MTFRALFGAAFWGTVSLWASSVAFSAPPPPPSIDVNEQVGRTLPADLEFTNHLGETVRLGSFFDGESPVILTMNYYRCATLCDITLRKLNETLQQAGWSTREDYKIVTVGIDPEETYRDAAEKRVDLGMADEKRLSNWAFLVGRKTSINALAKSVGFSLHLDEDSGQWAHPAAIVLLSPGREIRAYRYGVAFTPTELRFSLIGVKEWAIEDMPERILMSCFRYDDAQGEYIPYAWGIMRFGATSFLTLLILFIATLRRRERHATQEMAR